MPSLLTLPDVFGTSYRAALAGGVNERTRVTVIGDGPVDLLAVLSAKRLVRVGQRGQRRRADVDLELCGGPAGMPCTPVGSVVTVEVSLCPR
jgi:hypothetical protein